ncbi:MAG: hypothetical protein ABJA78_19265 [Ferruginibacter sp.]
MIQHTIKCLAIILIAIPISFHSNAQAGKKDKVAKYEAAVHFSSICCGTSGDDFLKTFLKKFNTQNKVAVPAQKLGGCGREGEFNVLFSLTKLKKNISTKFIAGLKVVVEKQNQFIKTEGQSKGPLNISYNIGLNEIVGCRGELELF